MTLPLEIALRDEAHTRQLGEALAASFEPGDVVLLEGELGAGKTTLVRFIVHALSHDEGPTVTSPTFALLHEYAVRPAVVHADLYRIGSAAELVEIGLLELADEHHLLLVEWGARFRDAFDRVDWEVTLRLGEGSARHASILAADPDRRETLRQRLRA